MISSFVLMLSKCKVFLFTQLFKGKFHHCEGFDTRNITNRSECLLAKYKWVRRKYNFDNLGQVRRSQSHLRTYIDIDIKGEFMKNELWPLIASFIKESTFSFALFLKPLHFRFGSHKLISLRWQGSGGQCFLYLFSCLIFFCFVLV